MTEQRWRLTVVASTLLGCAGSPDAGVRDVQQVLRERTAGQTIYRRDQVRRESLLESTLLALLRLPLTERSAVKVALLNNPQLQAELGRLGIAAAELHQAGLAQNPRLWGAVRFPAQGDVLTDVMGGLSTSFLSLFTLAAKTRVAEARLRAEILAVSHVVLRTVAEVRTAFVEVQRCQQQLAALRQLTSTLGEEAPSEAREGLALRGLEVEGRLVAAREHMHRLLGLWTPIQLKWSIRAPIASVPREKLRVGQLERVAVAQRLDLQAARAHTRMLGRTLQLAKDWGWLDELSLGASVNRPTTGDGWTVGPSASLSLPLFDQGQAAVARLEAAHGKSQHEATALAISIRSEVRQLRAALGRARRRARLLSEGPLVRAEADAEAVAPTPAAHAEAQVVLLEAYFDHLDALGAYWRIRHQLVRACGGTLPP